MTAAATARPVSAELPRSAHTSLAGGRSTWPDFIQKTRFSYCQTRDPARPTPTAAAIDDLDHLVGLLWHLDAAQRQLVWARACNVSWATLVTRMGRSRTGLNREHKLALLSMAFNLGGPRLASFRWMRAAILDDIWLQAASEALHSRWARQVGRRSTKIISMLAIGVTKDGYCWSNHAKR